MIISTKNRISEPIPVEFENQQGQQKKQNVSEINTQSIESVLKLPSKQFNFSCGVMMAKIDQDINNRFGLKWHSDNTTNLEDFIKSVEAFISISDNKLSTSDIQKLTKQYNYLHKIK